MKIKTLEKIACVAVLFVIGLFAYVMANMAIGDYSFWGPTHYLTVTSTLVTGFIIVMGVILAKVFWDEFFKG